MSLEDENIDKVFQEASKNLSFDFKEEYWNQFEAMLPKKKKRRLPFLWFTSSVAVIIAVSFFAINNSDKSDTTIRDTNPISKTISNEEVKDNPEEKTESKDKNTKSNLIAQTSIPENTSNYSKTKQTKTTEKSIQELQKTLGDIGIKPFDQISNIENQLFTRKNESQEIKSILLLEHNKINNKVDNLPFLSFPSHTITSSLLTSQPFPLSSKRLKIYFDLTGHMGQSIITENTLGSNLSKGFGIGSGLSYTSKNWNLTAGINATMTSIDNLYVKERIKIYGFGYQNYYNEIKYSQIYNLEMPIMAGIVKNKHIVQVGFTPSFLIGSKINYQSKTNDQVIISSSLYGYTKGLINIGIKPSIGYIYSITPSIQVGGNIQIQLISAIENNRFEGSITNKPISGQFFIRKSLFLK